MRASSRYRGIEKRRGRSCPYSQTDKVPQLDPEASAHYLLQPQAVVINPRKTPRDTPVAIPALGWNRGRLVDTGRPYQYEATVSLATYGPVFRMKREKSEKVEKYLKQRWRAPSDIL